MIEGAKLTTFLASTSLERSEEFYVDALGLRLIESTPWARVFDACGTELRVTLVDSFDPQPFAVLGFEVADVRREVIALRNRGVQFLEYANIEQDEDRIWQVPGGGEVAWFLDAEGNTLSLQHTPPVDHVTGGF
jgi:catechol 2,3-dioxygenase-like lactoylglutathione lyase family enzyme